MGVAGLWAGREGGAGPGRADWPVGGELLLDTDETRRRLRQRRDVARQNRVDAEGRHRRRAGEGRAWLGALGERVATGATRQRAEGSRQGIAKLRAARGAAETGSAGAR
jgi:predicted oxidoreductase